MTPEKEGPRRATPFDGLAPRALVARGGKWPTGELVEPEVLEARGLTPEQAKLHLLALERLRRLALDYDRYTGRVRLTNSAAAQRVGLGRASIQAVRDGTKFPSWRTYMVLRCYIPTDAQMNAGRFPDAGEPR